MIYHTQRPCSKSLSCPVAGSQPGWSDIIVWQQSTDGKHNSTIQVLDGVSDGQLIFASILVSA